MINVEPKGAGHWIDHCLVEGKEQEEYLRELAESIKKGAQLCLDI
ncbi:MAG: hypothetical protein ACREO5_04475 [Candidatus Binatia bacterium]